MVSIWKCSRSIHIRSVHSDVLILGSCLNFRLLILWGYFFVILQLFLFLWYNWPEWLGGPIFELQLAIWKEYEIALWGTFWWAGLTRGVDLKIEIYSVKKDYLIALFVDFFDVMNFSLFWVLLILWTRCWLIQNCNFPFKQNIW